MSATQNVSWHWLQSFEKGYDYIPIRFVGYDSIIEDAKFHYRDDCNQELEEKHKIIEAYRKSVIEMAKNFSQCKAWVLKKSDGSKAITLFG